MAEVVTLTLGAHVTTCDAKIVGALQYALDAVEKTAGGILIEFYADHSTEWCRHWVRPIDGITATDPVDDPEIPDAEIEHPGFATRLAARGDRILVADLTDGNLTFRVYSD